MRSRSPAALTLASLLWLAAAGARAEVYMWVDEHGVTHYTLDRNEVPAHLRDQIRDAAPAPAAPATPAARPPALVAPRPEPPAPPEPATESAPAPTPPEGAATSPATTAEPEPSAPLPPVESGVEPGDSPDVARMKEQIAADRERIKQLLAEPGANGEKLAGSAELRETAERLARKQAELAGLHSEANP